MYPAVILFWAVLPGGLPELEVLVRVAVMRDRAVAAPATVNDGARWTRTEGLARSITHVGLGRLQRRPSTPWTSA